jgi:hypothetical protein
MHQPRHHRIDDQREQEQAEDEGDVAATGTSYIIINTYNGFDVFEVRRQSWYNAKA